MFEKRKLRKRNREIRIDELLTATRDHYIRLKNLSAEAGEKSQDELEERGKRLNTVCPSCGSKNVNDRIKRTQGEFSGSGSINGIAVFGFGAVSGSSRSKGSIDTNEVNKCNDCEHEWKKEKEYVYIPDKQSMERSFDSLAYLLQDYEEYHNLNFDKTDLSEVANSLEEKKAEHLKDIMEGYRRKHVAKYFSGIPIECIYKIALLEIWPSGYTREHFIKRWDETIMEDLGCQHIKYSV